MNNFTFPPHFLVTSRLIFRSSRWFSPAGTVPTPRRLATADCWRHPLRGPRSGSRSSSSGWALHQPGAAAGGGLPKPQDGHGGFLTWGIPKNLMAFLKCVNGSMTWMIRWLWGWPYLRKPSNFRSQRLLSEKLGRWERLMRQYQREWKAMFLLKGAGEWLERNVGKMIIYKEQPCPRII